MKYNPELIEPKWQAEWEKQKAFRTPTDLAELKKKPKYYILDMFPYPSGAGLHVGHPEGYTATDVIARMKRMKGFHVLHPMGWDAFGLPAERAAVRENIHPAVITKRNVDNFRKQIKRLGFSYDWEREVDTSSSDYYQWTQWIFLKLFEKGLAYLAEVPVNWCPALGTVLANEEVKDGKYVETGDLVERRLMKQWMLKITVYAERLLEDLDGLDWPEGVKEMQRNWIGKSIGAEIRFDIASSTGESFVVFTTRTDTLFGATYCVLAPEHPLVSKITSPSERAKVDAYVTQSKQKTDMMRTDLAKDKSGVFTGAYAIHPVTGTKLPVWVADYVLMTYGTGAIMSVPAHDERDHEFAKKFDLPIIQVLEGGSVSVQEKPHTEDGTLINSDFLNGLAMQQAQLKMAEWLEKNGKGKSQVQYRLRDWLFSRQRYWGEPVPILHTDDGRLIPCSYDSLPVELPPVDEYKPTEDGKPPLGRASQDWLRVKLPDGTMATRELNTMPQWAGSCWYYLRYMDAKNTEAPWSKELENYWMPVDLYVGGVEHAVLHLLYARFWHKVLFDCGLVHTKEPFQKLFNQGMILAHSYQDKAGKYYHPSEVEEKNGDWFVKGKSEALKVQIEKMSKSKQNVFNPDDIIAEHGADAMRLYELFMGPLEQVKPWQMDGVEGVSRFLARVWRLLINEYTGEVNEKIKDVPTSQTPALDKLLHKTIKQVEEQTEQLKYNTAISQMMIFINEAYGVSELPKSLMLTFLKVLSPYAPHLAEELWHKLGQSGLIVHEAWPKYDPKLCEDDTVTIVIQVNGKKRDELSLSKALGKAELEKAALESENVKKHLQGQAPKKVIVVPGRLVNIVV